MHQPSEAATRRLAALEMIRGGAPITTIATTLGYSSKAAAKRDINRALIDILNQSVEEVRAIEVARLDGLIIAHWPQAKRGDNAATDRILKIMDMRAKLLGLYAPTKSEMLTMDAIDAEIKRLEEDQRRKAQEKKLYG